MSDYLQIAKVVEVNNEGLLIVESILDKSEFQKGGSMFGYCYSWGINKYSFTNFPESTMKKLGLTQEEYNILLPKIIY